MRGNDKPKTTWNARPSKPDHQESATFDTQHDDSTFNSLCTLTDSISRQHSQKLIAIDHHLYDQLTDTWIRKYSEPQPFIKLTVRVSPDDYAAFGFTLDSPPRAAHLPVMADTGCQNCLAGIKVLHRLGLNRADLLPVTVMMHAANNKGINILGAIILRLKSTAKQGRPV